MVNEYAHTRRLSTFSNLVLEINEVKNSQCAFLYSNNELIRFPVWCSVSVLVFANTVFGSWFRRAQYTGRELALKLTKLTIEYFLFTYLTLFTLNKIKRNYTYVRHERNKRYNLHWEPNTPLRMQSRIVYISNSFYRYHIRNVGSKINLFVSLWIFHGGEWKFAKFRCFFRYFSNIWKMYCSSNPFSFL